MRRKALILFSILIAVPLLAQEKASITVKGSETNNGVVIVTAQKLPLAAGAQITEPSKKAIELQCNKGVSSCMPLKAGDYVMEILPPNHGMYECTDVQVYAKDANPATADKLGEYCLNEK